ncbi:glucosaminidase domain-containing protein [Catenovulum adriaticum]|uniref:Glucosaminidase domain-containing protein n=1 Tax=Catenovulum adriaticum TaxID=2984846 RepID=A0ABY7ASI2_9ALTE|nr:glucosaminidase domain-containing protein [Catenovulum sp. TS8]WAJ71470.1 glucosaminidase domain-containing protein [Catenovulum sp. TS8]
MKLTLVKIIILAAFIACLFYPFIQNQHIPQPKPEPDTKIVTIEKPKLAAWLSNYPKAPDFSSMSDVQQKKLAFFSYFYPLIKAHNAWIEEARQFVQTYQRASQTPAVKNGDKKLAKSSTQYLQQLFSRYKISLSENSNQMNQKIKSLLIRMDVIPAELILIQAANESGWGTSRFAREGNNFFGQWCYQKGCGLVPNARIEGMNHEVASYQHAYQALDSYYINVNTHAAYRVVRDMRASYRKMGQLPSAEVLTTGLIDYSERGADYVQDLIEMLRDNQSVINQAKANTETAAQAAKQASQNI